MRRVASARGSRGTAALGWLAGDPSPTRVPTARGPTRRRRPKPRRIDAGEVLRTRSRALPTAGEDAPSAATPDSEGRRKAEALAAARRARGRRAPHRPRPRVTRDGEARVSCDRSRGVRESPVPPTLRGSESPPWDGGGHRTDPEADPPRGFREPRPLRRGPSRAGGLRRPRAPEQPPRPAEGGGALPASSSWRRGGRAGAGTAFETRSRRRPAARPPPTRRPPREDRRDARRCSEATAGRGRPARADGSRRPGERGWLARGRGSGRPWPLRVPKTQSPEISAHKSSKGESSRIGERRPGRPPAPAGLAEPSPGPEGRRPAVEGFRVDRPRSGGLGARSVARRAAAGGRATPARKNGTPGEKEERAATRASETGEEKRRRPGGATRGSRAAASVRPPSPTASGRNRRPSVDRRGTELPPLRAVAPSPLPFRGKRRTPRRSRGILPVRFPPFRGHGDGPSFRGIRFFALGEERARRMAETPLDGRFRESRPDRPRRESG